MDNTAMEIHHATAEPIPMWHHNCPVDGPIMVGEGEKCSWCGAAEDE